MDIDEYTRQLLERNEEYRKQLLENRKMIRKRIVSLITDCGFRRRGRSVFYRFIGENVVFFHIDHPTITFFIEYGVYPLYMPPMHQNFFYEAERLSFSMDDRAMDLADGTTQEELDVWCAKADLFIRDRLMPFFQRISTAEGIACYLKETEQDLEKRGYAPPGSLSILRFRLPIEPLMYAELAAHELDRAVRAAHAYLAKIKEYAARRPLGEEVRQSMEAQAHQVLDLAAAMDPQVVDAVLNGWRKHNAAFVAGTTAVEG
ncbi:MAG: hypothetical protein IKH77_05005 [Clostridia bacterium]|nr:hypothetical protein [Clostridia bacterium]